MIVSLGTGVALAAAVGRQGHPVIAQKAPGAMDETAPVLGCSVDSHRGSGRKRSGTAVALTRNMTKYLAQAGLRIARAPSRRCPARLFVTVKSIGLRRIHFEIRRAQAVFGLYISLTPRLHIPLEILLHIDNEFLYFLSHFLGGYERCIDTLHNADGHRRADAGTACRYSVLQSPDYADLGLRDRGQCIIPEYLFEKLKKRVDNRGSATDRMIIQILIYEHWSQFATLQSQHEFRAFVVYGKR